MTDRVDLEALRALERAATPGPWVYEPDDEGSTMGWVSAKRKNMMPSPLFKVLSDSAQAALDADLVEALRNAFPAMADEIERLREALDSIRIYGSDTLSGRVDGPDDRQWQRESVLEMTRRARAALGEPR